MNNPPDPTPPETGDAPETDAFLKTECARMELPNFARTLERQRDTALRDLADTRAKLAESEAGAKQANERADNNWALYTLSTTSGTALLAEHAEKVAELEARYTHDMKALSEDLRWRAETAENALADNIALHQAERDRLTAEVERLEIARNECELSRGSVVVELTAERTARLAAESRLAEANTARDAMSDWIVKHGIFGDYCEQTDPLAAKAQP